MDINLLTLFELVMEERHVGRAARRVSLSPSAVSHGLGRLRRLLNDPLFVRTPTGVVPTARAEELAAAISGALARIREIVKIAGPFDPRTSTRRFVIVAPDGVSAVVLAPLLSKLHESAPGMAIGLRQLLPAAGETLPARIWRAGFEDLETRVADIAVVPSDDVLKRFALRPMYEEDFIIGMRPGHPLATSMTPSSYASAQHLVVSASGDPNGLADDYLAEQGLTRRVMLTVPNFMFACAIIADSDLICAFPRRFAAAYAERMAYAWSNRRFL